MSYSATRFPASVRFAHAQSLEESLYEEGYAYDGRGLIDIYSIPGQLTPETSDQIKYLSEEEFEKFIAKLSRGARYMANRIRQGALADIPKLMSDWAAVKNIRLWMYKQGTKRLVDMKLARVDSDSDEVVLEPGKLFHAGIRFAWQAERFCQLYEQVCIKDRVWASSKQVDHQKVRAIALTPGYKNLPTWVKKVLVESPQWIETERHGDVWRLVDCAKAWKWCGSLPKRIAERIGKMPVKKRLLAALTWLEVTKQSGLTLRDLHEKNWFWGGEEQSRQELEIKFWRQFKICCGSSPIALIKQLIKYCNNYQHSLRNAVEILIEMPFGVLSDVWGKGHKNEEFVVDTIAKFGDKQQACQYLFGVSGKATIRAFNDCHSSNAWKWASAIAYGNADYVQKFLALKSTVPFQEETVDFLKSLALNTALRMVQTTTFKHHKEVHQVEEYHIKDTGYLWNQLQPNVPELGRVRCWLSVHEQLTHEYVEHLPDFNLRVNPNFAPLDGLCSIKGDWEIVIPTRNAQLKLWGQQLNHCIGAYGAAVNSGESIIFALKINGTVTYTVEMISSSHRYACRQFYGLNNSSPSESIQEEVLGTLISAKLCW